MIHNSYKTNIAFSTGIASNLLMLWFYIKIWILDEVVIGEPNHYILGTEIILAIVGTYWLVNIFKNNWNIIQI